MTLFNADLCNQIQWLAHARPRSGGLLVPGGRYPRESGEWGESRDYAAGDDYRLIDWHACARHDELVSRQPPGCPNRCVYLLVDCSRSMSTGLRPKFELARRVAAVVGAAALGRLDQVAVLAFSDRLVAQLPRCRGRWRWQTLVRFLESLEIRGATTDLAWAAECLARFGDPPGLAVVVGDFFSRESYRRGLEVLRYRGHVPCVVHVFERQDAEPAMLGEMELCDVETGNRWTVVLGRRELTRYRQVFEEFCRSVQRFCRQRKIGYVRVSEDMSWQRTVFELTGAVVRKVNCEG
jgi:uncharacterized protein (DUF58 family)